MSAARGFPDWPTIETIDISLGDDFPTVLQVFEALKANFVIGQIYMAGEFKAENTPKVQQSFANSRGKHVPQAIGLISTDDTIQYANMILESA